jgi:hypothetical protein
MEGIKTAEEYFEMYVENYNLLKEKDELWRLKCTAQEFKAQVSEMLKEYYSNISKDKYEEYRKQSNVNGKISILLMDLQTHEEIKQQFENHRKLTEKYFAESAPKIQEYVATLWAPLLFDEVITISKAIFRKQITLEMLPDDVLEAFTVTSQNEYLKRRGKV